MKISKFFAILLLASIAFPCSAQTFVEAAIAQPKMSSLKSPVAQRSTDADLAKTLYEEFAEIEQRPCDGGRKTIIEKSTVYLVCFTNIGGGRVSPTKFISYASESHIEFEDGIGYWYHFNAKVAAIRYFHTGELFFFDRNGTLQAELICDDNRSVRTTFSKTERDHLEKLAREGGEKILSKFKLESQKIAPKTGGNLCNKAFRQGAIRLETIPNVTVETGNSRFTPLSTPYPDAKAGLYREYRFALSGSGVVNVWKSRELMTEITKEITASCVGVAAVSFGRDRTSDSATVGLFPDGSIKPFICGADFDQRTLTRPTMTWGQQSCD